MKVKNSYNYSETQNITFSVPKASALGPLLFIILINDKNSTIQLLVDNIKLALSNEITQMDLNKLSYWEDIRKLKYKKGKCKELHIGSQNMKVEYKWSNREIKKVNEECNLGIGFDNTFKADNYILLVVSRANGKIKWMVRNFISREANVLKIYKS